MIRVYRNGKLDREYGAYSMKYLSCIKDIYNKYKCFCTKNVDINERCEEPMQYVMRENGIELEAY